MSEIPTTCALYIGGQLIPDGATGDPLAPVAVDDLTVTWGRQTSLDQPAPGTCTVDLLDRGSGPTRVDQLVALGATLVVYATVDAAASVIVFSGRITDLDIEWDDAGGGVCSIIAADLMADLASRYVGAEPWPTETLAARAGRIMAAIGAAGAPVSVDARPAALPVSRVDVDRQAAANLLRELATSGTAVAWVVVPAATAVPALRIEDPAARASMRALVQARPPSTLWVIEDAAGTSAPLDACAVLRDPVHWSRSVTDMITRVTVRWLDQSTAPDPTERTVSLIDAPSEVRYGARGVSVGTILSTAAAADASAQVLIAGHRPGDAWRIAGLTWDLGSTPVTAATRELAGVLLGNDTRIGVPLTVGPLPWWAPQGAAAGVYIEGGTYRYTAGRWLLVLTGLPATGAGGSLSYASTPPSIRYVDIDPAITFLDMIGVGPRPNTGPAWSDVPAGNSWASVPAGVDWYEGGDLYE